MKVLIIAQYFPPDMGGGATRAYNVAKGLMLNDCKVTVVTAFQHYPSGNIPQQYRWKPFKCESFDGLRVIRTLVPPIASRGIIKRLVLFLSFMLSSLFAMPLVGRIDVIWAANPNIISTFPAVFYGVLKRTPVALNVDDLWPEVLYDLDMISEDSLTSKLMRFIAKLAYLKAKLITPISPGYVKIICETYGVNNKKVHVIRAGVDLGTFVYSSPASNCNENKFIVHYSGAFSTAYDFDQVLLAAKCLENVDGIEFVLQGGGELAGYVTSTTKKLKLKNVKIINKIVSREKVAKLLSEASSLILPLRDFGRPYLGISSKLYEYQAAGKPIICCAEGQPAEYVKETNSGIVLKPGDYQAIAKSVVHLKTHPLIADKLGSSGLQYVKNSLSIEEIGLRTKTFLQALNYRFKVENSCLQRAS